MYFVLFTLMEDIDLFCFVYVYGEYRCILFCIRLRRISMYIVLFTFMEDIDVYCLYMFMEDIDVYCFAYVYGGY